MKNEIKVIIALIVLIVVAGGGRWVYLSRDIPEGRIPDVEPASQEVAIREGVTIPIETYVFYSADKQYADPFRYIKYLLTAPSVTNATILFEASFEGKENQYLVKAAGELSYILAYEKKNVTTRPTDTFRKMLIQAGVLGTVSSPVIYFKTPNVGGKVTRIIVAPGMIILESKNYEDAAALALVVRQVVVG